MQHTLIPLKDRQRLHRDYIIRAVIVLVFALAAALIVGVAALFPAYVRAFFYNYAAQNAAEVAQHGPDKSLEQVKAELASDSKFLSALASSTEEVRYSDLISSLTAVRGRANISHFSFSQTDAKNVVISIKGTAPTRAELIAFKSRLEGILAGSKVDIPIDQLAKNINPSFNLRFTKQLP